MTYSYSTELGKVTVNGVIPTLSYYELQVFKSNVMKWHNLAELAAKMFSVPEFWILGLIWTESAGNPSVVSFDGGYGLMQLTHNSLFEDHPKDSTIDNLDNATDDLSDPALNITLGTKLIANLQARFGSDLPKIASAYNAGITNSGLVHPSTSSPWGYRETPGHIMRTVKASNSAIDEIETIKNSYTNKFVKEWQTLIGVKSDGKFGTITLEKSKTYLPK